MNDRIDNMKAYLAEAEKDPENNKLYIEDLKLAISSFEDHPFRSTILMESGFKR